MDDRVSALMDGSVCVGRGGRGQGQAGQPQAPDAPLRPALAAPGVSRTHALLMRPAQATRRRAGPGRVGLLAATPRRITLHHGAGTARPDQGGAGREVRGQLLLSRSRVSPASHVSVQLSPSAAQQRTVFIKASRGTLSGRKYAMSIAAGVDAIIREGTGPPYSIFCSV